MDQSPIKILKKNLDIFLVGKYFDL